MSITVLRPNADLGNVAVVSTGGAANAVLSDNSDASYLKGSSNQAYSKMGLTTIGVFAPLRIARVRIRMRTAHDSSGGTAQSAYAVLYDPTKVGATGRFEQSRSATSIVTTEGPWVYASPSGDAFTEAVLDRMSIQLVWYASSDGNYLRVHELYVDVDTNARPSAGAVTVNDFTLTTRPTVLWAYSDFEGDAQTRYRVTIFSAAQYGAAGFNPDTSPSVYTSGDLFGSDLSFTLTDDLVNGTTYKAYVRAAQDWLGPEGNLWWSAWSSSAAFTVAVTPPPTPTLTIATLTDLPSYRAQLAVSAPVNLLDADQADFESGLSSWVADANCSITVNGTTPAQGVQSLQMTSTAAGNIAARTAAPTTGAAVLAGQQYTAIASFRSALLARSCNVAIRWYTAAGSLLTTSTGSNVTSTTTGYTKATVTATAPATAALAVVLVTVLATAAGGEVHRVDVVDLHAGSSTTWTTGGLRPTQRVVVERGDRVDSERGPAFNWAHPQVAAGGGVLGTTAGFRLSDAADLMTVEPAGSTFGDSLSTTSAIRWQPRGGTAGYLYAGGATDVGDVTVATYQFPVVANQSHTFSAWVWAAPNFLSRLVIEWLDASLGVVSQVLGSQFTATATPARYALTATAPAGAVFAWAMVQNVSSVTSGDVYASRFGFGLGSSFVDDYPGRGGPVVWTPVRQLVSVVPVGERIALADHEIPPARPVLYRARTVGVSGIYSLSSLSSGPVTTFMAAPVRNVLIDPFAPSRAAVVNIEPQWSESQSADAQVFHPLGRDASALGIADPVQIRDWLGSQDASYTLTVLSEPELFRLRRLLSSARSVLLQHYEGGQKYMLVVDDRSTSRVGPSVFKVGVKTIQTARPI